MNTDKTFSSVTVKLSAAALLWSLTGLGSATAALQGVTPGNPNLFFSNGAGATVYSVATGLFHVQATPLSVKFVSGGADFIVDSTQPRSLTMDFYVDQNGNLVGGVAGDDLVVTGTVTDSANTTYTGVLLKGEIRGFGYLNLSSIDAYDFRFEVTGGRMAPLFAGKDIGIRYQSEGSTFTNSFKVNFSGGAKGNLGPITALCSGSIGSYVWFDTDRNGIQDGGEQGIDGVKLTLKDGNGNVITSVSTVSVPTSQGGYYQFTGLCAGNYKVEVDATTVPVGLVPTLGAAGADRTVDSNSSPAEVNLPTNSSSDQTIDFGYISPCTGSIGDFVWHDKNRNGLQDAGESGLAGVTVNLLDPTTSAMLATAITGSNGAYQFTGLCMGDYTVEVDTGTLPAGFTATASTMGSDRAVDGNGSPVLVNLPDDAASDQTLDFGYVSPCTGSFGDFVWHDQNRNGLQDASEPGLDGVTVKLLDPVTEATLATAITGPNGAYRFTGLCAGDYKVEVDTNSLPVGFTPTTPTVGPDRAVDSNGSPALVNLPDDNTANPTLDFGYVSPCTGSLGDFVWHDQNRNGLQDAGEPGLAGVKVNLLDLADNSPLATTTTGSNGDYQFTGLCTGDYKVEVDTGTLPTGFAPTIGLVGADEKVDSNGSPATVTLPADTDSDQSIDFGYVSPCTGSMGNLVWFDQDRDGIQDTGEPGLGAVTVNLRNPADNTLVATAITETDGSYQFTGLCAGAYKVEVVQPQDYEPTLLNASGSTPANDSDNPNGTPVTLPLDNSSDQTIDFGYKTLAIADMPNSCELSLQKTANPVQLTIPKTGGSCPNVTYTYTLTNQGAPVQVTLSDDPLTLGAEGSFTLAANETKTITQTACITETTTEMTLAHGVLVENSDVTCDAVATVTINVTVSYGGTAGCTLGYWKQPQHAGDWQVYHQNDNYWTVFGVNPAKTTAKLSPNLTLLQALQLGGGGENNLARQAVAALLNAAHPQIDYFTGTQGVIASVQQAYASGKIAIANQATRFDAENNKHNNAVCGN